MTYSGSGDPPSAAPSCYTRMKFGESVRLKVHTFASEAGIFDLDSISHQGNVVHENELTDVTDGMRSLWKVPVDVFSKSRQEEFTGVKKLENKVQLVIGSGFHSSSSEGVDHDAESTTMCCGWLC